MIIDDIVSAFAECEGWWNPDPAVIPRAANNPMDLIYESQAGATGKIWAGNPRSFACWDTPEGGIIGAYRQVLAWAALDYTLAQMVSAQDPGNAAYQVRMAALLPNVDFNVPVKTLVPPLQRLSTAA